MKWIIVNLYNTPKQLEFVKVEERRTIEVDDIECVKQSRKHVKRDDEFVWDNVTLIAMKSTSEIECSDSFRDVIAAIELARNTENRRRKAGEVFFCAVIDVQEIVAEGVKEAVEEDPVAEEVVLEDRWKCPFNVGDVIVSTTEPECDWTVTQLHGYRIKLIAKDGSLAFVRHEDWGNYKIVKKGRSNVQ